MTDTNSEGVREVNMKNCDHHSSQKDAGNCWGIVQVTPAPGWHFEYDQADGGVYSAPLVGWGVQCDGTVVPLGCSSPGFVTEIDPDDFDGRIVFRPGPLDQMAEKLDLVAEMLDHVQSAL